jgi:hypothetical protein
MTTKNNMKNKQPTSSLKTIKLLAACGLALWSQPLLKADVVVLQSGDVLTGTVLQKDADGVLLQTEYGTYRYPQSMIRDVKKEAATAPHVSNNGQRIPDWAQIVSLLAKNDWATGIKQVPATVINYGKFNNVPYVSFRCATGGYEINIFGDLNNPAAVEIGAMTYLKNSDTAKSNCVNFICSALANSDDRKMVRGLNWNQKDVEQNGGMSFETLLPGEWGSYGGWWVMVFDRTALANAAASETELLAITQPRAATPQPVVATAQPATATQPPATTTGAVDQSAAAPPQSAATTTQPQQPVTTTTTTYATPTWSEEEMAQARRVGPGPNPATTPAKVYPRTYTRTGGAYGPSDRR